MAESNMYMTDFEAISLDFLIVESIIGEEVV
jgi:hypothetical protein